jgi:hypothetical protein
VLDSNPFLSLVKPFLAIPEIFYNHSMNDLALNTETHDLLITGLDLSVIKGADRVRQNILIKLKLWTGEWFLDNEFGTPYIDNVLGKQVSLAGAVAALKKSILEVNDVSRLDSFKYSFDRQARALAVDFVAATPFGLIRVTA